MTDEQGQIALAACARDLVGRPESCERTLRHIGGTEQLQHRECAQRSRLLALHLEQALHSADAHAYPAGYALATAKAGWLRGFSWQRESLTSTCRA